MVQALAVERQAKEIAEAALMTEQNKRVAAAEDQVQAQRLQAEVRGA